MGTANNRRYAFNQCAMGSLITTHASYIRHSFSRIGTWKRGNAGDTSTMGKP